MKVISCVLVRLLFLFASSAALRTDNYKNEKTEMKRSLQSGGPRVTALRLINADTDQAIPGYDPVPDLALISVNLDLLPPATKNLSLEAIISGNASSVAWNFLGNSQIENKARWAYCGNSGDDFSPCREFKDGVNATMTITPRSSSGGNVTNGTTLSTRIVIFRPPAQCQVNLTLINAISDTVIGPMSSTASVDLSITPNISIRADVGQVPRVSYVQFFLNGRFYRNDSTAPYAFNGNNGSDYFPWSPTFGQYTITAQSYNKTGTILCAWTVILSARASATCNTIVNFINNKTLSGRVLSGSGGTQEDAAVEWLCNQDWLPLNLATESGRQSLLQRYILLSLFREPDRLYAFSDVCDWRFVRCNSNGTIQEIQSCNGCGTIPPDVGLLSKLELFNGTFQGTIPSTLGNLFNLSRLELTRGSLGGTIPVVLGSLTKLTHLDLSLNGLISGTIPPTLGNLAKLTYLDLSTNFLRGMIPFTLGNLAELTHLDLGHNDFVGIPDTLGNLAKLAYLDLQDNELSGFIPGVLSNIANLTHLSLFANFLSGTIPDTLGNLAKLTYLNLGGNDRLTGTIPNSFGSLTHLTYLSLFANADLGGAVPSNLCGLMPPPEIDVRFTSVMCSCCVV